MSVGLRALTGHALGMVTCLFVVACGPVIMDTVVCGLGAVSLLSMAEPCRIGSSHLGEGGLGVSWAGVSWIGVASLLAVVLIMEAGIWLLALYNLPSWAG